MEGFLYHGAFFKCTGELHVSQNVVVLNGSSCSNGHHFGQKYTFCSTCGVKCAPETITKMKDLPARASLSGEDEDLLSHLIEINLNWEITSGRVGADVSACRAYFIERCDGDEPSVTSLDYGMNLVQFLPDNDSLLEKFQKHPDFARYLALLQTIHARVEVAVGLVVEWD